VSTDDEQRQQAALREYARSLSDEQWNLFTAQVRPPTEIPVTDPVSARQSIAAKSSQLLAVDRTADGSPANSWTAAVAARQPASQPQPTAVETPQPQRDTGYTGSPSLRRTPFVTPPTS
jgi:hypothetical protein